MKCKLGFSLTEDGQLLVVTEYLSPPDRHAGLTVTQFRDEGTFLQDLLAAGLHREAVTSVITNILLVISGRGEKAGWTLVEVDEQQLLGMRLSRPQSGPPTYVPDQGEPLEEHDVRDMLMQSPTPITMMVGPKHVFTFINPAYVRLIGRKRAESVLGKAVRGALPELAGQRFFDLLDGVYESGKPFIGREMRAELISETDGKTEEFFFDFIYSPVCDKAGQVYGILCQATDVTERVLARHVSEGRESILYRQWAELEALYKAAPVGMALVDAREYRVLRINEANARLLGLPLREILGRKVFELLPGLQALHEIYQRVASGEVIRHVRLNLTAPGMESGSRFLFVSFSPVLGPCGNIEAIASITVDHTDVFTSVSDIVLEIDTSTAMILARLPVVPQGSASVEDSVPSL